MSEFLSKTITVLVESQKMIDYSACVSFHMGIKFGYSFSLSNLVWMKAVCLTNARFGRGRTSNQNLISFLTQKHSWIMLGNKINCVKISFQKKTHWWIRRNDTTFSTTLLSFRCKCTVPIHQKHWLCQAIDVPLYCFLNMDNFLMATLSFMISKICIYKS